MLDYIYGSFNTRSLHFLGSYSQALMGHMVPASCILILSLGLFCTNHR